MPMKEIKGWVKQAKYYPHEQSIMLVLEEVESKRQMAPTQISITSFKAMGIQVADDDHEAWKFFAKQLLQRKHPLTLQFEDNEEG